ncbi:MAG TPA: hypothetical protein VNN10_16105 [Dehalococcoidia bacterium]|nr:hypothetical protein [Dehalococcoidia bacterium]
MLLAREPSEALAAFVAWVPVLAGDREPDAGTLALAPDARVQHFWDPDGTLAAPFKSVLALPGRVRA